MADKTGINLHD